MREQTHQAAEFPIDSVYASAIAAEIGAGYLTSTSATRCPGGSTRRVIAAGGRIAGPAAEALLASRMDHDSLDWLTAGFFKTGLGPGHCLRTPPKAPASAVSTCAARGS
jgi:hypothetical protein